MKTSERNAFHRYRIKHYEAKNANQYHRMIQSAKQIAYYFKKMKRFVCVYFRFSVPFPMFRIRLQNNTRIFFSNALKFRNDDKRKTWILFTDSTNARPACANAGETQDEHNFGDEQEKR